MAGLSSQQSLATDLAAARAARERGEQYIPAEEAFTEMERIIEAADEPAAEYDFSEAKKNPYTGRLGPEEEFHDPA